MNKDSFWNKDNQGSVYSGKKKCGALINYLELLIMIHFGNS